MLVLSRRVGESVIIGDEVVVTVLEVRGDVIRVGVDAPRHVKVHRQELLDELAASNRAAASASDSAVEGLTRLVTGKTGSNPTSIRGVAPDPGEPLPRQAD